MSDKTIVTIRGQTSIPARLRREYRIEPGTELVWEAAGEHEWRVYIERKTEVLPNPTGMLGFARQFRKTRSTEQWMRELREGE
ncbi:MAG: sporulation regulator [Deltaproteobacteria bacterium]|nr:sporulation regulator [Deltaproteobacteria bacterium]